MILISFFHPKFGDQCQRRYDSLSSPRTNQSHSTPRHNSSASLRIRVSFASGSANIREERSSLHQKRRFDNIRTVVELAERQGLPGGSVSTNAEKRHESAPPCR